MKKSRFTDEQIVGFVSQAETGVAVKELCRTNGFSNATFYNWRAKFGGMQACEVTRLSMLALAQQPITFSAEPNRFRQCRVKRGDP